MSNVNGIEFRDFEGNVLESWQVPLDDYVEAHEGLPNNWTEVHRLVVARAIAQGKAVSEEIKAQHDRALLQADIDLEVIFLKHKVDIEEMNARIATKGSKWSKGDVVFD